MKVTNDLLYYYVRFIVSFYHFIRADKRININPSFLTDLISKCVYNRFWSVLHTHVCSRKTKYASIIHEGKKIIIYLHNLTVNSNARYRLTGIFKKLPLFVVIIVIIFRKVFNFSREIKFFCHESINNGKVNKFQFRSIVSYILCKYVESLHTINARNYN